MNAAERLYEQYQRDLRRLQGCFPVGLGENG
jgi:hypothetical protein